jgi:murein tripeptide amidase MpaA
MLNPDGVVYGNYRCSLLGVDLNRRWINPSKILHPTIYYTKQLVKMMDIDRSVEVFTDIHGHSRKFNIFTYACCYPEASLEARNNALIKVFPSIMNERMEAFSFKDCRFANEKEKEATARMVMFKEFSILNAFTLEASFFGTEPPEPEPVIEEEEQDDQEEEPQQ